MFSFVNSHDAKGSRSPPPKTKKLLCRDGEEFEIL